MAIHVLHQNPTRNLSPLGVCLLKTRGKLHDPQVCFGREDLSRFWCEAWSHDNFGKHFDNRPRDIPVHFAIGRNVPAKSRLRVSGVCEVVSRRE